MRRSTKWSLGFLLLCGAVAGWLVTGVVPQPALRLLERDLLQQTFNLARPSEDPAVVTPAHWFFLPQLFGDFDLEMDIELAEDTDVDVLLRRLEPRFVDQQLLPFTGRFSVLRMSTKDNANGGGWLTRDQALFGGTDRGVGLSAGHAATVWIEARGRQLRANVAGKNLGWFEADDFYGMFTMVAKGGKAVVHRLVIKPLPMPMWRWSIWTWLGLGALGAVLVAAILAMTCRTRHYLSSGLAMVLFSAFLPTRVVSDLGLPNLTGMLAMLGSVVALGVLLGAGDRRRQHLVTIAIIVGLAAWAMMDLHHDTSALDPVFGPKAGATPSEAHGQLVRGPQGLLDVDHDGPRVFLLGGQPLYDRGAPGDHLALGLQSQLRARTRKSVEVPCPSTAVGYSVAQQWRLYENFYQGFAPQVIVFGVGAGNDEGQDLQAVLAQVQAHCAERSVQLVAFADVGLAEASVATLRTLESQGLSVVWAEPGAAPASISRAIADALAPLLD